MVVDGEMCSWRRSKLKAAISFLPVIVFILLSTNIDGLEFIRNDYRLVIVLVSAVFLISFSIVQLFLFKESDSGDKACS